MTVKNRYSDPAIGQAFESLAGLFAPMSANDIAGYASADLNRQNAMAKAQQIGLTDMFVAGDGFDDKLGVAAGLYAPTQSMRAVEMGDATQRYGYDQSLAGSKYGADRSYASSTENNVRDNATDMRGQDLDLEGLVYGADRDYAASTENNVRDNRTTLQTGAMDNLMAPLDPGQQTRAIDDEMWRAMGLEMPATPEYSNDRVDGSDVKITNVRLPNGQETTAMETANGLVDPSTGEPLPQGTTMFSTSAQGSNEELGLGKTPQGKVQIDLIDNTSTQDVGQRLVDLVSANPASQGTVGWLRGKAQDLIQTGGEIGQYFGGEVGRISEEVTQGVADAALMQPGGAFDTSLPAIDLMMNLYVYNYAKSITGERLSNEAVKQWRQAMGMDNMLGNQANTLARLEEAQATLRQREGRLREALNSGAVPPPSGAAPAPAPAAPQQIVPPGPDAIAPPVPAAPAAPQRLRYNPTTGAFE